MRSIVVVAIGRAISILAFAGDIEWCVFIGWFGVSVDCGLTLLRG